MFETNFSTIDWILVAAYLAGAVAIGVFVNKYIHNISDYLVGGRASGAALNTATFVGTGLGLVTIMYAGIEGFRNGFSFLLMPLVGVAVGVTLGSTGFVIRRLREAKLTTIPEYFQVRYDRKVRATAGIICAVAGILNMALFPKMGATFLTFVSGYGQAEPAAKVESASQPPTAPSASQPAPAPTSSPAATSRAAAPPAALGGLSNESIINIVTSILILLVLLYTVMGGMVSVIVTDYLQFIILSIGLGLGLYYCLSRADLGWGNMVAAMGTHRGERAFNPVHPDSYGWLWSIWQTIHFAVAALVWAPEVTRALTSKDPTATKRTFLFGAPGQFARLAIPVLLAVAAYCYVSNDPELAAYFFPEGISYFRPDGGLGAAPEHADQAMPLVLGKIIPTGLLGILVAGMMAAFMSTHDSYFLCWSSVITRDVIGPMRRRELSDKSQIGITRISIVLIGIFLLIWGVWYDIPDSVWTYMAVTGSVYMCGAIVVLVGGMYWKRASNAGAMAALLGGLISLVAIFLPDAYRNDSMLMGILGVANYGFCLLLFIVFSLLLPNRPRPQPQQEAA